VTPRRDAGCAGAADPRSAALARLRERLPERFRLDLDADADPIARWPAGRSTAVVFLVVADGSLERRLVDSWIRRHRPPTVPSESVRVIPIPDPSDRRIRAVDPRLVAQLSAPDRAADADAVLFVPLRVAWLPPERGGERTARLKDLVTFGDPRTPGKLRQRLIALRDRPRARVIAGESASLARLRADFERHAAMGPGGPPSAAAFAAFVARRAGLALEQAETRLLGARYEVPRLVIDDILSRADFRAGLLELSVTTGRPVAELSHEAAEALTEMAAGHSKYMIDLSADFARWIYTQAYEETIHYDRERFEEISVLMQRYPVVFLPSHKSYLDPVVMRWMLHQEGLPPNHTAAGQNMNFWPIGPIYRRAGAFFIRRSFRDDAVYKFVIRQYVGYLVEKRFHLEWYLEGGRSRSGKLLPPKLGLLTYVVDAYEQGRAHDIVFQPVAIAYDQLSEVESYAAEAHGGAKRSEGFRFLLDYLRKLRRRYGQVAVNFGEPLSLRDALGPPDAERVRATTAVDDDTVPRDLQKLAFEVAVRINRVTPVTATSLVTMAMLGTGARALTVDEITEQVASFVAFVDARDLPTTPGLSLDTADAVHHVLDALVRHKVVTAFAEGPEPVYQIGPSQQLAAAYYRNTIAHHFLVAAIAELALLKVADVAAAQEDGGPEPARPLDGVFWDEVMELRDLLKFEFFFSDKEAFRDEVAAEVERHDPVWEKRLARGAAEIHHTVSQFQPFTAHLVLRPFLDAYRVIADSLVGAGDRPAADDRHLLGDVLGLGKQYALRGLVASAESASRVLFESGLRLAHSRQLVDEPAEPGERAERRAAFARTVADALRRVRSIEALAASRQAGLIG
jgi:glycerol-3-phosphate O-acyltransferase